MQLNIAEKRTHTAALVLKNQLEVVHPLPGLQHPKWGLYHFAHLHAITHSRQ